MNPTCPAFRLVQCVLALLLLGVAESLAAQQRPTFSFEGSVGRGTGRGGGELVNRSGTVVDGMIAWRGRTAARSGPVIAANAMWQGRRGDNAWCVEQPNGACVSTYPSFTGMSVLGGWEIARGHGPSLRLLTGPGLFVQELGAGSAGLTMRLDLGTPLLSGVALIGSGRIGITEEGGDTYTLSGATLGLRIH